jgi:hypothetical protein
MCPEFKKDWRYRLLVLITIYQGIWIYLHKCDCIIFAHMTWGWLDSNQWYNVPTFAMNLKPLSQRIFDFIRYNSRDKAAASTWRVFWLFRTEMASEHTDVNSSASTNILVLLVIAENNLPSYTTSWILHLLLFFFLVWDTNFGLFTFWRIFKNQNKLESKGCWWWCRTLRINGFVDFVHHLEF